MDKSFYFALYIWITWVIHTNVCFYTYYYLGIIIFTTLVAIIIYIICKKITYLTNDVIVQLFQDLVITKKNMHMNGGCFFYISLFLF